MLEGAAADEVAAEDAEEAEEETATAMAEEEELEALETAAAEEAALEEAIEAADATAEEDETEDAAAEDATEEAATEEAAAVDEEAAEDAATVDEAAEPDPLAYGTGVSPSLVQPVFAVNSLGQVIVSQSTVGLSAPSKKSPKRKSQPGCSAVGKVEQVSLLIPPYCAPQPPDGAPHSSVHPL